MREEWKKSALRIFLWGGAALFSLAGEDGLGTLLLLLFLLLIEEAALADQEEGWAPDAIPAAVVFLGLAAALCQPVPVLPDRLAGGLILGLPFFLPALLRPGAFGGADIKLAAACGFFLGSSLSLDSLVWSFLFAGIRSLFLLLRRRASRTGRFAFLPFLAAGIGTSLLISGRMGISFSDILW